MRLETMRGAGSGRSRNFGCVQSSEPTGFANGSPLRAVRLPPHGVALETQRRQHTVNSFSDPVGKPWAKEALGGFGPPR